MAITWKVYKVSDKLFYTHGFIDNECNEDTIYILQNLLQNDWVILS